MSEKADLWMALYIGAYLSDTMHLARQHHGSYLLLIMAAFKNTGWLPNDDVLLAQIAKCTPKEWKAERAVYAAFFQIADERWTHKRVTAEWAKAKRLTDQRRSAGAASAAARQRDGNDRSTSVAAEDEHSARQSESEGPRKNSEAKASGGKPPARDVIFSEGLPWLIRRTGKSRQDAAKIIGKWCSEHGDDAVLELLQSAEEYNPVNPISWIVERFKPKESWNDKRIREGMAVIMGGQQ